MEAGGDVVVLKWLHARGLSFDVVNNAGFGAVSKAAYHRHKEALRWLLLDKEGPSLLWQLQPRLDVELARKICGHSDGDETCTLEKLIVDGGWGTVDNFLKANASKVVAGTKFSYPDVRVVAARERQPKLNNIVVERV